MEYMCRHNINWWNDLSDLFLMGANQDRLAGSRRVELPGSKRRYREENL